MTFEEWRDVYTPTLMSYAMARKAWQAAVSSPALEEEIRVLRAERDAALRDAERYRFIRDADRSDCISHGLRIYALESLDEYVDAAMEDKARAAKCPRPK